MSVEKRKSFLYFSPLFLFLNISALLGLGWFILWFISSHDGDDPMEGMNFIFAFLTLILTTGFNLQTYKAGKYEEKTEKRIANVTNELQLSNEELFERRLQIVKMALSELGDDLTTEQVISLIPQKLRDRTEFFIYRAREFEREANLCREIANFLEAQKPRLKKLAKDASDLAISRFDRGNLKRSKLSSEDVKFTFYGDIFLYIEAWLKYSIFYNFPMPLFRQSVIGESEAYVKTLKLLKDEYLEFLSPPGDENQEIVKRYLDILICQLEER